MSRSPATALLRDQAPEPGRCWIAFAPSRWPGPAGPWLDLATGRLGEGGGEPDLLTALAGPKLEDVLYLPPVPAPLAPARDRLAARHAGRGTPVLLQVLPGDPLPPPVEGVVVVWDLLPLALGGAPGADGPDGVDLEAIRSPAHPDRRVDAAAWPLLAGLGGAAEEALAAAVAGAGIGCLLAVPLELSGRDRRALGETLGEAMSEERYLRLFHGEPPSAAALARAAARHGLLPLLPRPLPRPPLHGAGNLRVAAALAGCGELCLLLGEPESRAQALLRAARFAERAGHDLGALARERNLGVLDWLEGEARLLVVEMAAGGEPRLWEELLERLRRP